MDGTGGSSSLLGGLDLGSEEEEGDSLMKVMGEMMNTLLSKDVLYPSLSDLCRQVSTLPLLSLICVGRSVHYIPPVCQYNLSGLQLGLCIVFLDT